jgi:hypothetical protein
MQMQALQRLLHQTVPLKM